MGDTVAAQLVGHEPHGFLSLTVQQSAEDEVDPDFRTSS